MSAGIYKNVKLKYDWLILYPIKIILLYTMILTTNKIYFYFYISFITSHFYKSILSHPLIYCSFILIYGSKKNLHLSNL